MIKVAFPARCRNPKEWSLYYMELRLEQIIKNFGEKQVLKGVSLSVEGGKALGLLGRNGAGKTTTIRIVMGVFPADGGRVLLDGKPIDRSALQIGYLPEERGLYPKKIILEQRIYLASLHGLSRSKAKESAIRWLTRLGMEEYKDKKLDTLSKGNQQKIQLAATLLADPQIVILDEPFSGLDPVNAMLLKDVVKELIAAGKIVLFSSHQMNYVEEFCDEIAILNNGNIVLSGNIRQIKRRYDRSKILISSTQAGELDRYLRQTLPQSVLGTQTQGNALTVQMDRESSKAGLLRAVAESGLDVDEIKVYEPSLNDIFVQYTE